MSLQDTSSSFSSQSISDKELTAMGRVLNLHWLSHVTSLVRSSVPDLMLVSRESRQLSTWRLLLVLHSPSLAKLLQSCTSQQDEFTSISVPASTAQITDLLAALETGEMEEVEDTLAARLLCIKTAWHQDYTKNFSW